jgi:alpha,alpha-trehalase
MAGSVDLIQQGYTGIEMQGDALRFDPCLPDEIRQLRMRVRYRDHLLMLTINHEKLKVTSIKPRQKLIKIGVGNEYHELMGGDTKEFDLAPVETA